ncbi:TPA: hypothetical protein RQK28_000682 [Vibrio vulnificus]|nr:hypothetical protein [Vibrio vulnificus]
MNIENVEISIASVADEIAPKSKPIKPAEPDFVANFDKKDYEWRNELVALGLKEKNRMFTIPGQTAPIAITLATLDYQQRCGTNPRLTLFNKALSDAVLVSILEKYELEVKKSLGSTIKGYDFSDVKPSETLAKVLAVIVQEYSQRSSENSRPKFVSAKDDGVFG